MRGVGAYQALDETHQQLEGETNLPGSRYEALRDTQQELDRNPQPEPMRLIDILEKRRAELDRELSELRQAGRAAELDLPEQTEQADIDRALALQSGEAAAPNRNAIAPGQADNFVAPEQWTERGGMVEQQASAMDWLKHSDEVRQERQGPESPPQDGNLSQEDKELLGAARETEEQAREQEHSRSQIHEPPAP